ncbi:MAG: hypothetical protein LLG14_17340, partial [Nocardiaceae bacterium]|nr:hypothetical protein [Nocardiaceae bacterium]
PFFDDLEGLEAEPTPGPHLHRFQDTTTLCFHVTSRPTGSTASMSSGYAIVRAWPCSFVSTLSSRSALATNWSACTAKTSG